MINFLKRNYKKISVLLAVVIFGLFLSETPVNFGIRSVPEVANADEVNYLTLYENNLLFVPNDEDCVDQRVTPWYSNETVSTHFPDAIIMKGAEGGIGSTSVTTDYYTISPLIADYPYTVNPYPLLIFSLNTNETEITFYAKDRPYVVVFYFRDVIAPLQEYIAVPVFISGNIQKTFKYNEFFPTSIVEESGLYGIFTYEFYDEGGINWDEHTYISPVPYVGHSPYISNAIVDYGCVMWPGAVIRINTNEALTFGAEVVMIINQGYEIVTAGDTSTSVANAALSYFTVDYQAIYREGYTDGGMVYGLRLSGDSSFPTEDGIWALGASAFNELTGEEIYDGYIFNATYEVGGDKFINYNLADTENSLWRAARLGAKSASSVEASAYAYDSFRLRVQVFDYNEQEPEPEPEPVEPGPLKSGNAFQRILGGVLAGVAAFLIGGLTLLPVVGALNLGWLIFTGKPLITLGEWWSELVAGTFTWVYNAVITVTDFVGEIVDGVGDFIGRVVPPIIEAFTPKDNGLPWGWWVVIITLIIAAGVFVYFKFIR